MRRAVQALLTVVVASASLTLAGGHAALAGNDAGSDWGDGAGAGHGIGRMGPRAARTTSVNPATGPDFELPFLCGQQWTGSSRSGHSPSYYSIDFNSPNDLGKPVLATAPGTVITAKTLSGSYGRYVVVDHGNGYSSLYGHLNAIVATVGQYVDQGDLIGYLGTSGNSTGPHLHFEERRGGAYFPPYFHRATFHINSSIVSANCSDRPVVGDWNGDGTSDLGIFRNTAPAGFFYQHVGAATAVRWGHPGDAPVEGDFDGDHVTQIGVRGLAGGSWYLRSRDATISVVPGVGNASDMPLTGDWDGNGRANLGYYHPSTHAFYLRSDQGTYSVTGYGALGDRPIVGDWNHDGKDEIGLFRPSNATFYLRVPASRSFSTVRIAWAMAGDIPLVGDWNGDGTDELGVWRPSTARFYMRRTSSLTGPAVTTSLVWGAAR